MSQGYAIMIHDFIRDHWFFIEHGIWIFIVSQPFGRLTHRHLLFFVFFFFIRNHNLHSLENQNKYKIFFGNEHVHVTDSLQSKVNLVKEWAMQLQYLKVYWTLTLQNFLTKF